MKIKHLLFAVIFLLSGQAAFAQVPAYSWVKGYGATFTSLRPCVATDANNNVIFAGNYADTLRLGSSTLVNTEPGAKAFIIKYDPSGNVLWAKSTRGLSYCDVSAAVTDAAGNIYIAGYFQGDTTYFGNIGLTNTNTDGAYTMFVAKYDPAGNVLWAKPYGNGTDDSPETIAVAPAGYIYFTGEFRIRTTIGTTALIDTDTSGSTEDFFVAKLDASGNVLWAKSAGGDGLDRARGVCDTGGNLLIGGIFSGNSITLGGTTLMNSNADNDEILVAKYDPSGNVLWAKRYGGFHNDQADDIALDANNNIFIAGQFDSPSFTMGSTTLTNSTGFENDDYYIAKLDPSGNALWAKASGGNYQELIVALATDPGGNVYATGDFFSTSVNFGSIVLTNSNPDTTCYCGDVFFAKYDGAGNVLWAKSGGGLSYEYATHITADHLGNAIACGAFNSDPVAFDGTTMNLSSAGDPDLYIVKIDNITGIAEYAADNIGFSIYPNPATDIFYVAAEAPVTKIEVLNVLGEIVYSTGAGYVLNAGQKATLDLSGRAAGVYFVRLSSAKGTGTKKLTLCK